MTYHAVVPTDVDRIDPKLFELARLVSTATLTSQLQRRGFANTCMHGVLPLRPDLRLAGQAFTLRYIPHARTSIPLRPKIAPASSGSLLSP